jgi:EmrB/QacA subfamily drug resistance transporter
MSTRPRLIMLGVMLSIFLGALESTVVATAMPKVVRSLGGLQVYSWVTSGFLLTSTVTMPLWGRLSDLFGRRRTYLAGLTIFLLGSALSGVSQNMVELIVFRMLQGLGAGSLITIGMTIVGELFRLERRAKMQSYISGVWGLASLLGPLLGGLLTDYISWRWVFYINLPVGAGAMVLLAVNLPDDGERRRPAIDYAGVALFAAGVSLLLLALEAWRVSHWSGGVAAGMVAAAGLTLGAFLMIERRAAEPIVPLRLFTDRMVVAAVSTGFLSGMAMFGAISFVPLFLQAVRGFSATVSGFVLIPFVLGWVAMSVVTARLLLRVGYRLPVLAGMASLTTAFLLLSEWDPSVSLVVAMRDALLAGVGMGMTMVPMLIAVQSSVRREDLGAATSMTQFFRAVGGAIGVSVMGAVMAHRLETGVPMAGALHDVFVIGLAIGAAAFLSAFLVPAGRAQDPAREVHGEPTRVGG